MTEGYFAVVLAHYPFKNGVTRKQMTAIGSLKSTHETSLVVRRGRSFQSSSQFSLLARGLFQTPASTVNLFNVTIFRHPTIKICTIAVKWPPLIAVKRHGGSRESLVYFMGLRQSLLFPGGISTPSEKRERVTLDDVQTVVGS